MPLRNDGELPILKSDKAGPIERDKIFTLWDQYLLGLAYKGAAEGRFDIYFAR